MNPAHHTLDPAHRLFFATLANESRLRLLRALMAGPRPVGELARQAKLKQPNASRSLDRLLRCGFVAARRRGRERVYELNQATIAPLLRLMERHVARYCRRCCSL